jgi:hypothetical protein
MAPTPSRTLELGELRSLVVAAESGTIGRAALRLHVSQPTPSNRLGAAKRQALARDAPLLLSRHVLSSSFAEVDVDGLRFERSYALVLPAAGEPPAEVRRIEQLLRAAVAGW